MQRYLKNIDLIKTTYNSNMQAYDNKHKQAQRKIKNQRLNIETLNKTNVINMQNEHRENIVKSEVKIKRIHQDEKKIRKRHEQNKKISYNLFVTNQKNARKELRIQTNSLTNKWKSRAISLKKDFIKDFKSKKD